jgi:NADH-quinone oxidoreductase subunit J
MEILFYIIAFLAIVSGAGVISFRNPVYSALSLVVTLFSLAAAYALLSADFVAIIQILTYAGAIMVLFIFIIMLLNLQAEELVEKGYSKSGKFLLALVSLGLFLIFGYLLHLPHLEIPSLPADFGSVFGLGRSLFTNYVVPFEAAGFLLTVALVGAVLLAKRKL